MLAWERRAHERSCDPQRRLHHPTQSFHTRRMFRHAVRVKRVEKSRTFVNEERRVEGDYGSEYRFWCVEEEDQLIPVHKAEGAKLIERGAFDRLPPGVMARHTIELTRPVGTLFVLVVRRPKATRRPKRERRKFWLTQHGGLSRRPLTARPPATSPPATRPLPSDDQAQLARDVLAKLSSPTRP